MMNTIVLLLLSIGSVFGYPSGAPDGTCNTLLPVHGQNRPKPANTSPYQLTQTHEDYQPGDRVKVTLRAPEGISFKGLILQAYDPSTGQTVGTFQDGRGLKTMDSCSAVTHTDGRAKRAATLLWIAPQANGKVAFRATIVQRYSEFYHNVPAFVAKKA